MAWSDPRMYISLFRSVANPDQVNVAVWEVWYTGKVTAKLARKRHEKTVLTGSFVHPEPVHDVTLILEELGHYLTAQVEYHDPLTVSPGRERSGVGNIPRPPLNQPEQLPDSTPDDSDSALPFGSADGAPEVSKPDEA